MTQPSSNESVALVVDTTSSAASCWEETRQTADRIFSLLAGLEHFKLYALGSAEPLSPNVLRQPVPTGFNQQAQSCSLIAPITDILTREGRKYSLIIVGSGEIFDLDDWTDDPRIEGWLLVRTGDQSLQTTPGRIPEITPEQIRDVETLYFSPSSRQAAEQSGSGHLEAEYEWKVDASGYPLIWVEPIESYVHLFPITKPQFEKFIVTRRQPTFGDDWYSKILKMNPRVSYRNQDITMPEHLFMTGVTTEEAASFGKWLGREYSLLTSEEWCKCYEWSAKQMATSIPEEWSDRISGDARAVWEIIEDQCWGRDSNRRQPPTLQDLSLMTMGILEWASERPGRYCALGEPASESFQRRACDPVYPLGAEPRRLRNLGFRLRTSK